MKAHERTKESGERVKALRGLFDLGVFENWIRFLRDQIDTPLPGEPGFSRAAHILALREAIERQRERLDGMAAEHKGALSAQAHRAGCESRFRAAMELLAHRDPYIAEAWRYDAECAKQQNEGGPHTGLTLVHSRD